MYLLDLFHEGARKSGSGHFDLLTPEGDLPKWTLLPTTPSARERLELAALVSGGAAFVPRLGLPLGRWCRNPRGALHIEALVTPHSPRDIRYDCPPRRSLAIEVTGTGEIRPVRGRGRRDPGPRVRLSTPGLGSANQAWFFLAYGPGHALHRGTDRFDFSDPFFRVNRFRTLFDPEAPLTDPTAFLARLHDKACRLSRYPARQALARLAEALGEFLGLDTGQWLDRSWRFDGVWEGLAPWQRRALAPLLDATRHALDASPFRPQPLDIPCPILWDRPDALVQPKAFPAWVALVDRLFPEAQVVIVAGEQARLRIPAAVLARRLPVPAAREKRVRRRPRAQPGAVVLAQVDGALPNLALMKLSRHFKEQGRKVVLTRGEERVHAAESAFASAVFTGASAARLARLRQWYGDGLATGGSGVDLAVRLPPEIEALPADYALYPGLEDRALGFLTRGCPFHCPFCLVPLKEGPPRQVSDFDALLQGRRNLILLDDNLLAHPQADAFLDEMVRREIQVNFNQTLDLRLVNREKAELLRRVRTSNLRFTRRAIHFSLNSARGLEKLRDTYELFGFTRHDNVEFVCMYGYDTTLEQDVARFRFLRSLPGAYVFVQEHRPVRAEPAPAVPDFFGPAPDRLIREIVGILFTQNMKSMERYYRWLSYRYALRFGRLNRDLVETIFRYNKRSEKGVYLATLAHTLRLRDAPGLRPR